MFHKRKRLISEIPIPPPPRIKGIASTSPVEGYSRRTELGILTKFSLWASRNNVEEISGPLAPRMVCLGCSGQSQALIMGGQGISEGVGVGGQPIWKLTSQKKKEKETEKTKSDTNMKGENPVAPATEG